MEEETKEYLPGYATQQEFSQYDGTKESYDTTQVASSEQALIKKNTKPIQNHQSKTVLLFKTHTLEFEFDRHLEHMTLFRGLVQCTQSSNGILSYLNDYDFWFGFDEFRNFCTSQGPRVTSRIGDLLHHHGVQCRWPRGSNKQLSSIDPEEYFDSIVEANDILLERVDSHLDEASGVSKASKVFQSATATQSKPVVSSWNMKKKEDGGLSKGKTLRLLTATNIQRPQLRWKDKIDNSNTPFVPILQDKPNALRPWNPVRRNYGGVGSVLQEFIHQQRTGEAEDIFENRHPYEYELDVFEPHEWQLEENEQVEPYKSLQDTPCQMITTKKKLEELCNYLKTVKEFAVDLEHHSYRSFLGFTCLMQISTRERDFIVDTIELREEMAILNEVFTNPFILKQQTSEGTYTLVNHQQKCSIKGICGTVDIKSYYFGPVIPKKLEKF